MIAFGTFEEFYESYTQETQACLTSVVKSEVKAVVDLLWGAYKSGNRVWVVGNGGSATNAIHIASCLSEGTMVIGKDPLRSESLVGNIANFTASANDCGYEQVFVKQLQNCFSKNDVLIALSCSGNSPNVVLACEYVRKQGGHVIAFLGFDGGKVKGLAHKVIHLDNYNYGQVETLHLSLGHLISQYLKGRIERE